LIKILVTGKSGQLAKELNENNSYSNQDITFVGRNEANLLDQNETLNLISRLRPDYIIHTAAKVGGIKFNLNQGYQMLSYNLTIDLNVISAAIKNNVPNFLYYSSSCVYPLTATQPFETESLFHGDFEPSNEFYAIAKSAITKLVQGVDSDSNRNYKTLLLSNLYGRSDNFNETESHVLASAFKKIYTSMLEGLDIVDIWGDGKSRREFTLASDVADFTLKNLTRISEFPSIMNLGSGIDYSITEIYETIGKVLGFKGKFRYNLNLPNGVRTKLMDSRIAKNTFLWNPEINLLNGVSKELAGKKLV
jgi:GDP-L-fucose synthase